MHFDGLCRRLGAVDPQPLRDALDALGEEPWYEYQRRQQTFKVHAPTQTILLIYDEDMRHANVTVQPWFAPLQPVLQPVLDLIAADYERPGANLGYFNRLMLTRLDPNSVIPRHRDGGPSLLRSHRHHIPIVTNPLVEFDVGDETNHFAAGEVWEINNRQPHEVRNLSDVSRVHLIADYVVPGERIDDPEGTVFA